MAQLLPPIPKEPIEPTSHVWREWFNSIRNVIVNTAQGVIAWASLNFAGSNITDIATRNHNSLQTIQGGTANQYYHLTATQLTNLGTSGTSILYGNGSGGFSNVTIGSGVSFTTGTLSATGSGGTITSVTGTAPVVSSGGTTPAISMAAATTSVNGYLTSTDWNTFNGKLSYTGATGDVDLNAKNLTNVSTFSAATVKATTAAGYISSDGSTGYTGTVTTSSLVGMTITIKDGLITSFA